MKKLLIVLFILCLFGCTSKSIEDDTNNNGIIDSKEIEIDLNDVISTSAKSDSLDITTTDYYNIHLIKDDNIDILENISNNYLIYFHQEACSTCAKANIFIDQYIKKGYCNLIPLYIASYNESETLFTKYNVEQTPMLYYSNDNEGIMLDGYDEIIDFLNNIVTKAN